MPVLIIGIVVMAALFALFVMRGSTPRIDTRLHANSLAVLEQCPVSETRQWVLIRSEDVANPVVLFVHGGPGTSQLTLMRHNTQPLEKHFIVVNWDQRRAGKSFAAGRERAGMTMGQFVDDIIDLASHLAQRFHKERILLAGHSWGERHCHAGSVPKAGPFLCLCGDWAGFESGGKRTDFLPVDAGTSPESVA